MCAKGLGLVEIERKDREMDGSSNSRGGTDPKTTLERIQHCQDPHTAGPSRGQTTGNDTMPQ